MSDKLNVKILTCYHKPSDFLKTDVFMPVHGGRAVANEMHKDGKSNSQDIDWLRRNMVGDDTGDNISELNRYFNELTVVYWAWKHYEELGNPDYIGFMQYRRHFILHERVLNEQRTQHEKDYSVQFFDFFAPTYWEDIGLTDDNIRKLCAGADAVLCKRVNLPDVYSRKEDFVRNISGTKADDFDALVEYIRDNQPQYYEEMLETALSVRPHLYQSFIVKKEIFFDYCNFLFPILFNIFKNKDFSDYSANGKRTIGYMGEILFNVYFSHLQKGKKYVFAYREMSFIQRTDLDVQYYLAHYEEKKRRNFVNYIKYKSAVGKRRRKYKIRYAEEKKILKQINQLRKGK